MLWGLNSVVIHDTASSDHLKPKFDSRNKCQRRFSFELSLKIAIFQTGQHEP